ncbi:toxin C-terminal domain-containing protein, partial [Flavobacterium sp.]|uniref:toxin C-terminal domain-containing protein n=1 Tax=Flavobacterium sp. TaxID=239 RepID=UPI00286DC0CF
QDGSASWTGGNPVVNFGNFMSEIKQNYNQGINDRVNNVIDFFTSEISSGEYWGNSLQSLGNDVMQGRSIMFNASPEYKLETFNNTKNMSANEWAYSAGYSSPDIAASFVSPYAMEGAFSRMSNFRIPAYTLKALRGSGGFKSLGAAAKGFSKIPKGFKHVKDFGYPHGQNVYKFKGNYYSKDIDVHNGGVWKVFENIGGRLKRIGTADANLNIFKN